MNYDSALRAVRSARQGGATVGFVSPAMSVCLAAERSRGSRVNVNLVGSAGRYASVIGLTEALDGTDPVHIQGNLHGRTYSPLAWLYTHEHIHQCNETIARLLGTQLKPGEQRRSLLKIVGELHDNVASHARGKGFSAAQVYANRIEYAIADAGCGFLRNARSMVQSMTSHADAIQWAFVRGNTSAGPRHEMGLGPQRGLGADSGSCAADEDAHAGWGLDELRSMIDQMNGVLWVTSGDAGFRYSGGEWMAYPSLVDWNGVFVEFEVPRGG